MPDSYPRGTVLKCYFPYDSNPSQPGPLPHYCLVVEDYELAGQRYAALCYGTSKLDDRLMRTHRGLVFSVPSNCISGAMPGVITHFIGDHVALVSLDDRWRYPKFQARLDFVREQKDPQRRRLFEQFTLFERAMVTNAIDALDHFRKTGKLGLPRGKLLRTSL